MRTAFVVTKPSEALILIYHYLLFIFTHYVDILIPFQSLEDLTATATADIHITLISVDFVIFTS